MRSTAARVPDSPAIIGDHDQRDFASLDRHVDALAAALLADGITPGDRVGIWMPTGFDFVSLFCAVARIGAIAVPVNTRYRQDEVRHVLAHAGVKILFAQPVLWRTDTLATLAAISPAFADHRGGSLALAELPELCRVVVTGSAGAANAEALNSYIARAAGISPALPAVVEEDPLLICFTSGSTGRPKGVVHNHRVVRHCRTLADIQGLAPGERSLANWPLHHAGGLFLLLLPALIAGSALVLIDQWSGAEALRLIAKHRVSVMGGIPTHYIDMIDDPAIADVDTQSLRYCYMGGANVARTTFDRILSSLSIDALPSTYGLTENTVSATFNRPGDPDEWCALNIAPVVADCAVRIVDPDSGQRVPVGTSGEIQFRGPTLMEGYYRDADATRSAITPDGWLRTGDLGCFHLNGYLQPTGRLKEMLKVGGSNVSPTEVEAVLNEHPAVRNSVVVGVPDERLTEVAFAIVELRDAAGVTPGVLIEHCRGKLADYKVPRGILELSELPRLSTGKIDRAGLTAIARRSAIA